MFQYIKIFRVNKNIKEEKCKTYKPQFRDQRFQLFMLNR